jgi:hypothetical protein
VIHRDSRARRPDTVATPAAAALAAGTVDVAEPVGTVPHRMPEPRT